MDRAARRWFDIKAGLIIACCAAGLALVVQKAYSLQIVEGARYRTMAEEQYTKEIELPARRGAITDRHGIDLAVSMPVDSIFLQPGVFRRQIQGGAGKTAAQLSRALNIPAAQIRAKMESKRRFAWLKRQVTPAEAAAVSKLAVPGVSMIKEFKRYHPLKRLAAQVIGFTDIDGKGQGGIEKYFNLSLTGQVHVVTGYRDAKGREVFDENPVTDADLEGRRIELTIDANVQRVAEDELERAIKGHGGIGGMALVMEPFTGEILALANSPSFDPDDPSESPSASWNNQALTNPFEPGSTMKSFLLAAALQEKAVRPEDRFDCEGGAFQIGSRVIHDAHPYNVLTVAETVKFSSNICSAKIGLKLGREKLHRYLRGFGFGEPAEISLPAESRGILPPAGSWADINTATISFGQGVSVSAVQLAGAFAAIANGGNLMRPRIVRRVVTRRGEIIKEFTPEVRRRVISPEVAAKVTEILATVTEQGGTGTAAAVDGFSVAGKTGTAQKVDSATKGYSADKRIGLFAGFVPASAPKLVVVVAVDEPKGIAYGGVVAAPAFKTIATVALKNLGIFPMPGPAKTGSAVPEAGGDDESREGSGDGYVGEDIAPRTGAAGTVPNFLGLPVREAIELGVGAGVEIEVEGTGRAVSQKPAPGSKYRQGSVCRVVFSRG